MNSKEIQDVLMLYMDSKPIQITNYSGLGHEADVLMVTKARMVYEYEVKTSRADFKKDFSKVQKHKIYSSDRPYLVRARGYPMKPNHFYYVCAEGLIKPSEIPKYAGLIYITTEGFVHYIKKAPKLHSYKLPEGMIWNICSTLTARIKHGCSYIRHKHGIK